MRSKLHHAVITRVLTISFAIGAGPLLAACTGDGEDGEDIETRDDPRTTVSTVRISATPPPVAEWDVHSEAPSPDDIFGIAADYELLAEIEHDADGRVTVVIAFPSPGHSDLDFSRFFDELVRDYPWFEDATIDSVLHELADVTVIDHELASEPHRGPPQGADLMEAPHPAPHPTPITRVGA